MSKATFSLAEQAIEKLTRCVENAPVDRLKLIRLQHHVTLKIDEGFSRALKPLGLNQTEWLTMLFLYSTEVKRFSPSELAKSLNCSRTNATRIIEALKKRDFIHCAVNSTDRRKMQVSLNDFGRTFVDKNLPAQFENINATIGSVFSAKEEELFLQLNMKLLHYFEKNV